MGLKEGRAVNTSLHRRRLQVLHLFSLVCVVVAIASCASPVRTGATGAAQSPSDARMLQMQALVMAMADDYIAALREARHAMALEELSPSARTLAQEFHRNGVSASLTIGSGPHPPTAMLDMLVLAELRAWAFETQWIPEGIGEVGRPALARLQQARDDLWEHARKVLSKEQEDTIRQLIAAWIEENPDRMIISMVRFDEFAQERMISSALLRGKAAGLLSEVTDATAAIDDARLLGERLRWFAGRYPILVGAQVEDTTYRLFQQPEAREFLRTLDAVQEVSETFDQRIAAVRGEVRAELEGFFASVRAERAAALEQFFDGVADQRTALLDDLEVRQGEFVSVMKELRDTIAASKNLTSDLTVTVETIDRVVARFQSDPNLTREPLRMEDVRDAAIETGKAAQEMTRVLQLTNELLESQAFRNRVDDLVNPAGRFIDRSFWRGAALVGLLVVGLGLIRLIPQRVKPAKAPS